MCMATVVVKERQWPFLQIAHGRPAAPRASRWHTCSVPSPSASCLRNACTAMASCDSFSPATASTAEPSTPGGGSASPTLFATSVAYASNELTSLLPGSCIEAATGSAALAASACPDPHAG